MADKKVTPKNPTDKEAKKTDDDKAVERKTAVGSHKFRKTGRVSR
jgi:hypothetical protein